MRYFQMRQMLAATLIAAFTSVAPVVAGGWADCCGWNDCCWDGEFYGTVEALYWKPSFCAVDVGVRQFWEAPEQVMRLEQLSVKPSYQWGVRGRIGYETDCSFLDVAYLYIGPTDTSTFGRGAASSLLFPNVTAELYALQTKTNIRYQNVDVRYGSLSKSTCGSRSFYYGNARWVNLQYCSSSRGKGVNPAGDDRANIYRQDAKFNGGGLGVGIGNHYCIGCGFGVGATLGVMAVIGDSKLSQKIGDADRIATPPSIIAHQSQSRTSVIPGFDFRFGFDYALCWDCFSLTGEIGYELNYYWSALRYSASAYSPEIRQASDPILIPPAECQNAGFGGLYLGLTFAF